jgi:hypothetical protein
VRSHRQLLSDCRKAMAVETETILMHTGRLCCLRDCEAKNGLDDSQGEILLICCMQLCLVP